MKKTAKNPFEGSSVSRAILTFALPTIISQLITTVYNLADTFWVGRLGDPNQLAALSVVFPMQLLMTATGNLFGIGAGTCISAKLGEKDFDKAKLASVFSFYFGGLTAILFAILVFCLKKPLMTVLGSTAAIDGFVSDYLNIVMVCGALPAIFNLTVANMLRGEGLSFAASAGLSLGGLLNIILDPFFVLPGYLGMNVKGAAVATLISNSVTTLFFVTLLVVRRRKTALCFRPRIFEAAKTMGAVVLFTGLPSALMMLLSAVSNTVLNKLMIRYGETAEAAVGITKKIDAIPFGAISGLTQGVAPLIAYDYGANNRKRLKKTVKLSFAYSSVFAIIVLTIIECLAKPITSLFINDALTIDYATNFLRLHCASLPFLAVTFLLISFFQAVGAKTRAFLLSIIRKGAVDIPLMFLLDYVYPVFGIILCQPVTDVISAITGALLFFGWHKKHTLEDDTEIHIDYENMA